MTTYDYTCEACSAKHEISHSMASAPKRKCPSCGKMKLKRQIGLGGGVIFYGAGFYCNDYSDDPKKGKKGE